MKTLQFYPWLGNSQIRSPQKLSTYCCFWRCMETATDTKHNHTNSDWGPAQETSTSRAWGMAPAPNLLSGPIQSVDLPCLGPQYLQLHIYPFIPMLDGSFLRAFSARWRPIGEAGKAFSFIMEFPFQSTSPTLSAFCWILKACSFCTASWELTLPWDLDFLNFIISVILLYCQWFVLLLSRLIDCHCSLQRFSPFLYCIFITFVNYRLSLHVRTFVNWCFCIYISFYLIPVCILRKRQLLTLAQKALRGSFLQIQSFFTEGWLLLSRGTGCTHLNKMLGQRLPSS